MQQPKRPPKNKTCIVHATNQKANLQHGKFEWVMLKVKGKKKKKT